jgi:hypothetical protein
MITAPRDEMLFRLPRADEEGWPPATIEGIWVVPGDDGWYRIDNIPFFVRGISAGDEVSGVRIEGELWFAKLERSIGHRTVRVIVFDPGRLRDVLTELHALGCDSEVSHLPQLAAVDIPPHVDPAPIVALLRAGRAAGTVDYEEASVDW